METKKEKLLIPELNQEQIQIVKKVREIMNKMAQKRGIKKAYYSWSKMAVNLEKKYPDARKRYLFHVLIGSSIKFDECKHFDFPGEDSIFTNLEKWK